MASIHYSPFRIYCDFQTIKRAFRRRTEKSIYKYSFDSERIVKKRVDEYEAKPQQKAIFTKLSREFTKRFESYWGFSSQNKHRIQEEFKRFFIINFGYYGLTQNIDSLWIGDFCTDFAFKCYQDHISFAEALTYRTRGDIMVLSERRSQDALTGPDLLFGKDSLTDNGFPLILDLAKSRAIRLETVAILNYSLKFIERYNKKQQNISPLWTNILSYQWLVFQTYWINWSFETGFITQDKLDAITKTFIQEITGKEPT